MCNYITMTAKKIKIPVDKAIMNTLQNVNKNYYKEYKNAVKMFYTEPYRYIYIGMTKAALLLYVFI